MATEESVFSLIPRDKGSTQHGHIVIPVGETSVGRGPLLKVLSDKIMRSS